MKKIAVAIMMFVLFFSLTAARADWDPREKEQEEQAVNETIDRLLKLEPSLKVFFDQSAGYAVFPTVGKGAFIAGVGYGRGWLFEKGKPIGKASITQLSAGAQIGGQTYSEVIFLRDPWLVDSFRGGTYEMGAQASAMAVTDGVAAAATYTDGVAIFIIPKSGLMADLSVSGQRFSFEPF
jgi:lipid-binding SYLF domain-containing protein